MKFTDTKNISAIGCFFLTDTIHTVHIRVLNHLKFAVRMEHWWTMSPLRSLKIDNGNFKMWILFTFQYFICGQQWCTATTCNLICLAWYLYAIFVRYFTVWAHEGHRERMNDTLFEMSTHLAYSRLHIHYTGQLIARVGKTLFGKHIFTTNKKDRRTRWWNLCGLWEPYDRMCMEYVYVVSYNFR